MLEECYSFLCAKLGFATFENPAHAELPLDAGRYMPLLFMTFSAEGALHGGSVAYGANCIRRAAFKDALTGPCADDALSLAQQRGSDAVFGVELDKDGKPAFISIYPCSLSWREEIAKDRTKAALEASTEIVGEWYEAISGLLDRLPNGFILSQVDIPADKGTDSFAKAHIRPLCIATLGYSASPKDAPALLSNLGLKGQANAASTWLSAYPQSDAAKSWEITLDITKDSVCGEEAVLSIIAPIDRHGGYRKWNIPESPKARAFSQLLDESLTESQCAVISQAAHGFKMPYLSADFDLMSLFLYAKVESLDITFNEQETIQVLPRILFAPNGIGKTGFRRMDINVIQWHITDACDQRCKHCYIFAEDEGLCLTSTPFDKLVETLDQFEGLLDPVDVDPYPYLTGGDPILHPRFWDFAQVLHDRGIAFNMMGNPFHLTPEVCDRLYALGCQEYQMSIDGMEGFHDFLRKPGSFKTTLEMAPVLQGSGIESVVMMTVSGANVDEVEDVARLCASMNLGRFGFARYCPTNEDNAHELHIEPKRYKELLYKILDIYNEYRAKDSYTVYSEKEHLFTLVHWERGELELPEDDEPGTVHDGCHCGQGVCVLPNRDLMACRRMESVVGNLEELSVEDVFQSPELAAWREVDELEKCSSCELLGWCRGCRAVGAGYTGDWRSADPQCWKEVAG